MRVVWMCVYKTGEKSSSAVLKLHRLRTTTLELAVGMCLEFRLPITVLCGSTVDWLVCTVAIPPFFVCVSLYHEHSVLYCIVYFVGYIIRLYTHHFIVAIVRMGMCGYHYGNYKIV